MNCKILRVDHALRAINYYSSALKEIVDFDKYDYPTNVQNFYNLRLQYGNSISKSLRELGFHVDEIVYDAEILQKGWAKSRGLEIDEDWQVNVITDQINFFKPDILFFQNGLNPFPLSMWNNLKSYFPFVKKIIVHRGSCETKYKFLKDVDLLLLGSPQMVRDFDGTGANAKLMYHYFDATIVEDCLKKNSSKLVECSFLGSSGFGSRVHNSRYWIIYFLMCNSPLKLYADEDINSANPDFKEIFNVADALCSLTSDISNPSFTQKYLYQSLVKSQYLTAASKKNITWGQVTPIYPISKCFPDRCLPPVFGNEYYRTINTSKVSVHVCSPLAKGYMAAMRPFHITGCNSCLLLQNQKNMGDLFESNSEVVTFDNFQEARERLRFLIENPIKAQEISQKGHARTLKDHTSSNRASQISEEINILLSK